MLEPAKTRVLVVDDEPDVLELVEFHLEKEGYQVLTADSGEKALRLAREHHPDAIVLDLMLPEIGGLEISRMLKNDPRTMSIPILLLTARAAASDRVKGLETGVEDYVTKPFSPRELVLRVKNLLSHTDSAPAGGVIEAGPIRLDASDNSVTVDGSPINLTAIEFQLLAMLAGRRGLALAREILLRDVWDYDPKVDTRTVDTTIQRLRGKLGQAATWIETIRGVGYRFAGDTD